MNLFSISSFFQLCMTQRFFCQVLSKNSLSLTSYIYNNCQKQPSLNLMAMWLYNYLKSPTNNNK